MDDREEIIDNETQTNRNIEKSGWTPWLLFSIVSSCIGSPLLFGYNIGVLNLSEQVMKQFINESDYAERGSYISESSLTLTWAITVGMFPFGGIFGSLASGMIGKFYGRKGGLIFSNIFTIAGSCMMSFSKLAARYELLIAGRFIVGFQAGINALCVIYLTEIAPVNLRGAAGVINQIFLTAGVLLSEILGLDQLLGSTSLFYVLLGMGLPFAILNVVMYQLCPNSPRYLFITKHNQSQAERALKKLRATDDVVEEMQMLEKEYEATNTEERMSIFCLLKTNKSFRRPFVMSIVLQIAQQATGINAVGYYSTSMFKTALGNERYSQYATIVTAGMLVLMTLVSSRLVERSGRRSLLLYGYAGMLASSTLLTVGLVLHTQGWTWASYLCILFILLYTVSFAIGPGCITGVLTAEMFTQSTRSSVMAIAVAVNWLFNSLVGLIYPEMQEALGVYNFIPFCLLLVIFWVYLYLNIPETKGRTIEDITASFRRKYPVHVEEAQVNNGEYCRMPECQGKFDTVL